MQTLSEFLLADCPVVVRLQVTVGDELAASCSLKLVPDADGNLSTDAVIEQLGKFERGAIPTLVNERYSNYLAAHEPKAI